MTYVQTGAAEVAAAGMTPATWSAHYSRGYRIGLAAGRGLVRAYELAVRSAGWQAGYRRGHQWGCTHPLPAAAAAAPAPWWQRDECECLPGEVCGPCTARGYRNGLAGYAARIYPDQVTSDDIDAQDYADRAADRAERAAYLTELASVQVGRF